MAFQLLMDVAEPRISRDRLVSSVDGRSWDMVTSSPNVFIDPVTRTLMLRPLPTMAAWATTFTGDYYRLHKSDYTLTTAANWVENPRKAAGDIYLESVGNTPGESVTTAASYPVNQGWYVSFFVNGTGSETGQALEIWWGTAAAAGTPSLRIYPNGKTEVYKGTTLLETYEEGDLKGPGLQPRTGAAQHTAGSTLDLLIIPCRVRELLVLTSKGKGFSHTFADLSPSGGNAILPAGTMSWRVINGAASVQVAQLRYLSSGYAVSPVIQQRYAPPTGATFTVNEYHDYLGNAGVVDVWTLMKADGTSYTPDGVINQLRVRVDLSTLDTRWTPFVLAADAKFPSVATTTEGTHAFDLTPYVHKMHLSVKEHQQATLDFVCHNPKKLESLGLVGARYMSDRPIALSIDGIDVFRGTTRAPVVHNIAAPRGRRDLVTQIHWSAGDRSDDLALYTFADTTGYDGTYMTDAVKDIFGLPGFDPATDLIISTDTFVLPWTTAVSDGKFELLPKRGDSAQQWLDKLYDDFCATWWRGWRPVPGSGYKFWFRNPADLATTPSVTIYLSTNDAATAGVPSDKRSRRTVRSYLTETPVAPEANQILVIGWDPRTRKFVYSQYDDAASQDPAPAPASRPSNWRGRLARYQFIDPMTKTQASADRSRDILNARLTPVRRQIEFDADLLQDDSNNTIWMGDVVRIMGYADAPNTYSDWRITDFDVDWLHEKKADGLYSSVRTGVYHARFISEGGAP